MIHSKLRHISQTGPVGKLIAEYNWNSTSVGNPEHWPSSLLVILNYMLENKVPMILSWGEDFVQFYNDAFIPFLGEKHPYAIGKQAEEIWKEIAAESLEYLKVVRSGKPVFFEDRPWTIVLNGIPEERYLTSTTIPIRLDDGTVGGVFNTLIDTTQTQKSRRALEESEKNYRNYQDLVPISFFSLTEDFVFSYMNPEGIRQSHKTKEEIIGKRIGDVFPGAEQTVFFEAYKRALKGEMVEVEGRYEPNDVWLWIQAYPLNPGIGVMTIDVTESRKLQIELRDAVEDRDRFLSIASHELNTPLTTLKLHTQMMQRLGMQGLTEEKLEKYFRQTELQISRLSRLVDDMLDVSKIREGRLSLHFEPADLRPVLADIVERMNLYYLQSAMVVPDLKFDGQDFVCSIDHHRFEQIVTNLLTNAFKYGEGRPVHIVLADGGDMIYLTVQDSGPGIPVEDQEQIFKQYNRGSAPYGNGLGLGLFITKQIVENLGGSISLQSALGEGASFRVELPKVRN